jgi:hypothetical protein
LVNNHFKKLIGWTVALPIALTALTAIPAQAHSLNREAIEPTCSSPANSPSGDDSCSLPSGNFYNLDGKQSPELNVLANDGGDPNSSTPPAVCGIVDDGATLDPAIGVVSYYEDSSGWHELDLWINPDVTEPFSFVYRNCDGAVHTVTIVPLPYEPPIEPETLAPAKVTKAHKLGYLKVCVPAADPNLAFIYGTYKNPLGLYDGYTVVKSGKCKLVRVHRTAIDWEAFGTKSFVSAGTDHIGHIKLPKGDHLPKPTLGVNRPYAGHFRLR